MEIGRISSVESMFTCTSKQQCHEAFHVLYELANTNIVVEQPFHAMNTPLDVISDSQEMQKLFRMWGSSAEYEEVADGWDFVINTNITLKKVTKHVMFILVVNARIELFLLRLVIIQHSILLLVITNTTVPSWLRNWWNNIIYTNNTQTIRRTAATINCYLFLFEERWRNTYETITLKNLSAYYNLKSGVDFIRS